MSWAALAPIGGALIGGLMQQQGQSSANKMNLNIAREQMNWQQMMSSSAHQREVADLKNAGLNPILSANAGASTPSGASATMQNEMEGFAATGLEMAMMKGNLEKQKNENELLKTQNYKTSVDAKKANMEAEIIKKDLPKSELINDMYDIARPAVKKIKQMIQSNPIKTGNKN